MPPATMFQTCCEDGRGIVRVTIPHIPMSTSSPFMSLGIGIYTLQKKYKRQGSDASMGDVLHAYNVGDLEYVDKVNYLINTNIQSGWEYNYDLIQSVVSECFSIEWKGIYREDTCIEEVRYSITCNLQQGGQILKLTDMVEGQDLHSEIAWRTEMEEETINDLIEGDKINYYVTPLHIVYFVDNPKTEEQIEGSIWR